METISTILLVTIFVVGVYVFFLLQKKHVAFSKRVLWALVVGIVFGIIIQVIFGTDSSTTTTAIDWINIVGGGYVSLLQMLIMPLVFISIVHAFIKLELSKKLAKISFTVIATLLGTTAIAALIGVLSVLIFGLQNATFAKGTEEAARISEITTTQESVKGVTLPQQILSFFPKNIFSDLAGTRATSTIAVVIFAVFVGVAFLGIKKKAKNEALFFEQLIESFYKIIMRIVTLVLRLTPYGIFALMTKVIATSDVLAIIDLGKFLLASYVALLAVFVVHLLILVSVKVQPIQYIKKAFPALSFAFTSRSSAGTLPLNVETQVKSLGVEETIANFSASFGLSIGQNGCAGVYPAMLAAIVAPSQGIEIFSVSYILLIVAVVTISSLGVAGVGGGATFASLIVLGTLNLPVAIVGLVISVEPLIDMMRTAVNVSDTMVAGIVTSRRLGELNEEILYDNQALIEEGI